MMNINNILGNKSGLKGTFGPKGGSFSANINSNDVINKIRGVLENMPDVENATGKLNIKIRGQQQKTLTFRYK